MGTVQVAYDRERQLTRFRVNGEFSADDALAVIEAYYAGEVTRLTLIDFSGADLSGITSDQLKKIAKMIGARGLARKGGKTAYVLCGDLHFGLGRMAEALYDIENVPFEMRVFRQLKKALAWLGFEDPKLLE